MTHEQEQLIESGKDMARAIARQILRRLPRWVDARPIEAAATQGLVEAANVFRPEQGIPFRAFAQWRIRGAVLDYIREQFPSRQAHAPVVSLEELHHRNSRDPDTPDPAPWEPTATNTADDRAAWREVRELLEQAQIRLTPRERLVLRMYYLQDLTIEEIAKLLAPPVSGKRVWQIRNEALLKARQRAARLGLRSADDILPRAA